MTDETFRLIPLADALAPVRDVYRHLVDPAVSWQSTRRRRTDPDLWLLLCVAADTGWDRGTTPTRFTRTGAYHLLRCDVPNWCSLHRCHWPEEVPEAMWEWLDFLFETGRLDPASDPLAELRKPLLCYGGLDERGEPLDPDAPRTVECECHLPYRETVELLNQLGAQCEQSGQDPLGVLRSLLGRGPRHPRREQEQWWD